MQGSNDNRTVTRSLRPSHVRSAALAAAVVGVVVLPIAAAQANPSHSTKQPSVTGTPATGSPATAVALLPQYCGATETGLQGAVTAQSCVNYAAGAVTGVVYVGQLLRAQTLTVGINLTRGDGSLAQMTCVVAAHDANATCTTGPLQDSAGKGAFDAIAEMLPVNAPLSEGVLHVESGQVTPVAGSSAVAPSPPRRRASPTTPTTGADASASASGSPAA